MCLLLDIPMTHFVTMYFQYELRKHQIISLADLLSLLRIVVASYPRLQGRQI